MQKDKILSKIQKNYSKLSSNSLGMITKQQVRINCSEEISMKIHVKK